MKLRDISETFENDLQDSDFIIGYLELSLNKGLPTFLMALREVIQANGGMSLISHKTDLGRESLYKTLSESGNPQFATIDKILHSLGLKLAITISHNNP
ncbi:addiction module antidote protein [Geminocystis sp.]|uniref:addiction module antidote protein n=1 Tax=Geminocystis sp. TaxID=2664100 RepID=UPI00359328DF